MPKQINLNDTMRIPEIARRSGLAISYIHKLRHWGKFPKAAFKIGNAHFWDREVALKWIAERKRIQRRAA